MGDNGKWKDGHIVDYIQNPTAPYSEHMEKNFMIKRVPDSWLPRIKLACEGVGDEESIMYIPRRGKFNFTSLQKKKDSQFMKDERDKTKKMKVINASELGLEEITLELDY